MRRKKYRPCRTLLQRATISRGLIRMMMIVMEWMSNYRLCSHEHGTGFLHRDGTSTSTILKHWVLTTCHRGHPGRVMFTLSSVIDHDPFCLHPPSRRQTSIWTLCEMTNAIRNLARDHDQARGTHGDVAVGQQETKRGPRPPLLCLTRKALLQVPQVRTSISQITFQLPSEGLTETTEGQRQRAV